MHSLSSVIVSTLKSKAERNRVHVSGFILKRELRQNLTEIPCPLLGDFIMFGAIGNFPNVPKETDRINAFNPSDQKHGSTRWLLGLRGLAEWPPSGWMYTN